MARDITSNMLTELTADNIRPALLYVGEFADATLRLWTGYGDVVWSGETFLGNGYFQGVQSINETPTVRAEGIVVNLSGVPTDLASIILAQSQQSKKGYIYLALLDDFWNIIVDPVTLFVGNLDVPTFQMGPDTANINITYESRLIDLDRPREHRYTDQGQKNFYPADRGFEYMGPLQEWNGFWGVAGARYIATNRRRDRR